jgi:hypothetical protein
MSNNLNSKYVQRLLAGLGSEDQTFLLDWLADYGENARDEIFLPAALTVRLIIEQRRAAMRMHAEFAEDITAFKEVQTEFGKDRAETSALISRMQAERSSWEASAKRGVISGVAGVIEKIGTVVQTGVEQLQGTIDEPLAPLIRSLDKLTTLPAVVGEQANLGAAKGAREAATSALKPGLALRTWIIIAAAFTIVTFTAYYIGASTNHVPIASTIQRAVVPKTQNVKR